VRVASKRGAAAAVLLAVAPPFAAEPSAEPDARAEGERIFRSVCAACHGADGRGEPGRQLHSIPMPDFTDCRFATREPDDDFYAVAHEGGPVRGFSPVMPAHGAALGEAGIRAALAHVRSFCSDARWPRGELNLPRPLYTEKAYPEDEAVVTVDANADPDRDLNDVRIELLFEKRVGPKSQLELSLPFRVREASPGGTLGGVGDVALGVKHVLAHSLEWGGIASAGAEVLFPSGDRKDGLGSGTTVFEPYLAAGQIVARDGFVQAQVLGEIPVDRDRADAEVQGRVALGWSFGQDRGFGRVWTPMVEVIAAGVLPRSAPNEFDADLVPQVQVTLSRRQHVRLDVGVRIPLTHAEQRPTRVAAYLLWDWFDGGILEGW
jgi:mono/diheme cytochrome c family protein